MEKRTWFPWYLYSLFFSKQSNDYLWLNALPEKLFVLIELKTQAKMSFTWRGVARFARV